ncbi:MAG: DUF1499 domain-containing protein, partial [Hyphomicrobium sp.]
ASFATAQAAAYPDIKTIEINRSVDETYELVVDTIQRLKFDIVFQQPPEPQSNQAGVIEFVDRTMVLGLYDDVAVRVSGNDEASRVDVRSASRYGSHDLGRNAQRIRTILKEIVVRLESVPVQVRAPPAKAERDTKEEQRSNRRPRRRRN